MAYRTYITDALVCGSRAQHTSDKSYLLFTREAGMLYAAAKSVREERSKQRFALQEFSYLRATLIHGKSGWRVAGTEPTCNVYAVQRTREARALVRNTIKLLRRFLQGETSHTALFDEVKVVLTEPGSGNELAREEVLTIRILHALGYIAPLPVIADILEADSVTECAKTLDPATALERQALIDQAFHESQL